MSLFCFVAKIRTNDRLDNEQLDKAQKQFDDYHLQRDIKAAAPADGHRASVKLMTAFLSGNHIIFKPSSKKCLLIKIVFFTIS